MTVLDGGARLLLCVVLATAAAGKLGRRRARREFAESLRPLTAAGALRGLPVGALATVAVGTEAVAAVLLLVPATAPAGLVASAVLLSAYGAGILLAVRAGVRLTCRCFGAGTSRLGRPEAVRNLALATVAAAAFLAGRAGALPVASAPALTVAGTAGAVLALAVVRWDDLVFVLAGPAPRSS
jgi:hypothetical protein